VKFYTHLSDQFAPFHTKVIAATANQAPHVLDGLLYHQSSLVINEHYTDTGGSWDHVFAMCRLLGFFFAPRIRDLKDKRLYILPGMTMLPELVPLVAGVINLRVITEHWSELLRLAMSIKTGTVTASVILRKLSAYPRQNGLALALRELGKKIGTNLVYPAVAAGPRAASSQPRRTQQRRAAKCTASCRFLQSARRNPGPIL
jgi:TnpA family transposase